MRPLISCCILLLFFQVPAQKPVETVTLDLKHRNQWIEGWGSSLCWWAGQVGDWDEEKVDSLIYLITSPDQLNMNIFRFNIGGGDDPDHVGGHMVSGKGKRAEMEGYQPTPNGPYDWTADAAQRNILLKIKEARPDAVFEAFSNSPPYWMTKSGCAAGYFEAVQDNLAPERYEEFADYLIAVLQHYKEFYGVDFKTLDPFNESTSSYWGFKGSQEGCHFDPKSQVAFLKVLYPKLQTSGLSTVISVSDETSLSATLRVLEVYNQTPGLFDYIGQVNTHTYSGSNKERVEVLKWLQKLEKPFWQSETGPMGSEFQGVHGTFPTNLMLAQKMFDDLRFMEPQAWLDWQLLEEENETWCQIRANFDEEEFRIVKNFYVRMQVTRFIKQGYSILETDHEEVLAAASPDLSELVVIMLNKQDTMRNVRLNVSGVDTYQLKDVFRTSYTENCGKIEMDFVSNEMLLPAASISTLIFAVNN